jgi:hypothetical protein
MKPYFTRGRDHIFRDDSFSGSTEGRWGQFLKKDSPWKAYASATETLRKARWEKRDLNDVDYRKAWESAGVSGNETHYIQKAMEKLAPGKPVSALWVLPNRSEVIALAQQLKVEATKEK